MRRLVGNVFKGWNNEPVTFQWHNNKIAKPASTEVETIKPTVVRRWKFKMLDTNNFGHKEELDQVWFVIEEYHKSLVSEFSN